VQSTDPRVVPLKHFTGAERWDAIVVGSGIGGLGTAWLLGAKTGRRVLVLERHYTAGGFTHTFRRPGYEWDVGIHYVGQATASNGLGAMFEEVFGEEVQWAPVGEVYDTVVLGGRRYEYLAGRDRWRARMLEYFPDEGRAIDAYLAAVRSVAGASDLYWAEKAVPPPIGVLGGWAMRGPFLKHARRTTRDVLESITSNQELIAVLTAQWGDYGLPPARSSFAMHAILVCHYAEGAFYPVGGAGTLARAAADRIRHEGGAVVVGAEVQELLVEGGRVAGVKMVDGRAFRAPLVVSDAGLWATVGLVPDGTPGRQRLARLAARLRPSMGHMCLYVGLNATDAALGLPRSNLWVYPGANYERAVDRFAEDPEAEIPLAFISFPSAKDPTFSTRFPGHATIEVVAPAEYAWFERWSGERWRRRGGEYEGLKAGFCRRLLNLLYREVPRARGAVAIAELSTPITTRHFSNYSRGEMYGLAHDPARFVERALRPRTAVPGLWLAGQDVCTCGVGGALGGAYLAASAIARRSLLPRA
jgi:all-trans-retinol 13,14-reductase